MKWPLPVRQVPRRCYPSPAGRAAMHRDLCIALILLILLAFANILQLRGRQFLGSHAEYRIGLIRAIFNESVKLYPLEPHPFNTVTYGRDYRHSVI
jgi:hypothetical protein